MRNIIWELEFIHETLKKASPVAVLGGIVVLALGLIFGSVGMVLAGAFVALVGAVEFVIKLLFRDRNLH